MSLNFKFLKEEVGAYYKKEFYFWIFGVLFFGISLFFLVKELKTFIALKESYSKIEESYYRIQPEIVRLKEALSKVDWQREFKKRELEVSLEVDLRNHQQAFTTLEALTNSQLDTFFSLREMKFERQEGKNPILNVKGTKIIYQ